VTSSSGAVPRGCATTASPRSGTGAIPSRGNVASI
jgi:hypothetical protein